jgi:hypothetical protein
MDTYAYESLSTLELSVAMTADLDDQLQQHFNKGYRQEDLTFAIWRPSQGAERYTGVLCDLLLPSPDERILNGNAAFTGEYFSRVLAAVPAGSGIALLHSHVGPGWQGMSFDDVAAEQDRLASAVAGRTGLPLLGLTWGTDGAWSARLWGRTAPFKYERLDAATVRVVGPDRLALTFHPQLKPAPAASAAQAATVSVWGENAQADLARVRVGIVGLGSVGSIIADSLSRIGFSDLVLIDNDIIKERNLDRTLHAVAEDARAGTPKVIVASRATTTSHTASDFKVRAVPVSLLRPEGIAAALDCDVIISCVDRPFPRGVLNAMAYAHLIPVIDGGIMARITPQGRPLHIDWRIHTVGPGRACMYCLGALLRSDVALDRDGMLDDPDYIEGLSPEDRDRYNRRNVFPFSLSVAAHETLHLAGLISGSTRIGGIGPQHYSAYPGEMTVSKTTTCAPDCEVAAVVAMAVDLEVATPAIRGAVVA